MVGNILRSSSVGGVLGARTDEWRALSWEYGDSVAGLVCDWADEQPRPVEAVAALVTLARLGCPLLALFDYMGLPPLEAM